VQVRRRLAHAIVARDLAGMSSLNVGLLTSSYKERFVMDVNRLIAIYTPANRFEADVLMDALQHEDVSQMPSEIRSSKSPLKSSFRVF